MIRPSIGADPYRMRAPVFGAIDQEAADAGRAHFAEDDFLLFRHGRHQSAYRAGRQSTYGAVKENGPSAGLTRWGHWGLCVWVGATDTGEQYNALPIPPKIPIRVLRPTARGYPH
jgi:hypothetical protein